MFKPKMRRTIAAIAGFVVLGGVMSGCSSGEESESGKTVIDYGWWGSSASDDATYAAIKAFEKEFPDIDVKGEATPWAGYWDKLATMSAGKDAPDVIHMSERYIREYGDRGALTDLSQLEGIDLNQLDKSVLELGQADGKLYAIPAGVNSFTIAINTRIFKEAGVEIPDDTTWTWDDLLAASKATASDGITGINYRPGIENLRPWLFQIGQKMYNDDGTGVGFKKDALVGYLENILAQRENGGPSAAQVSEELGMPLESTQFGQGKQSMTWIYTSEMPSYAAATGDELKLMRIPSRTGHAKDNGMYLRGSSFYSISEYSSDEEKAAAAKFVNFMINNKAALDEIGMLRGVPPNANLVKEIRDTLEPNDKKVLDFVNSIRPELNVPSPAPSPQGSGSVQGIFDREVVNLLFDKQSVDETADEIIEAIDNELG